MRPRALRSHPVSALLLDGLGLAHWHLQIAVRRLRGGVSPHPARPIHLPPNDIHRGLWRLDLLRDLGLRRQRDLIGFVRDGDWDRADYPLEELGIFEAIRQRFEDDTPWAEIPYFREMAEAIDAGKPRFKYRHHADIPRQQKRIEVLHERISHHGFRSQANLGSRRPWDEIAVALDRDGRPLFLDGRHRLAVAQVLDCPRVPVLVGLRHRQWEELRQELTRLAETDASIRLPAHPDLPASPRVAPPEAADGVVDRLLDRVLPDLVHPPGPVLDLEPGFGHGCQRLGARGYDTFAVADADRPRLDTLRRACRLDTRFADEVREVPTFPLAIALGGGRERLWDLAPEALERRLTDLRGGQRLRHLLLGIPASVADDARIGVLLPALGQLLGLTEVRADEEIQRPEGEPIGGLGGGRLLVLAARSAA